MIRVLAYGFLLMILANSCSVRRFLPKDERLYEGSTVKIKKEPGVSASSTSLRKQVKAAARPKANKFLLGQPYKVWWWYVIGEPKNEKNFKSWLRNKLGEPPVLSSRVNAKVTAENMQAYLENIGYFHSIVAGDTVNRGYMTKAIYHATILPQYKIKEITWVNDSSELMKMLTSFQRRSLLKVGASYRLSDIESERDRLDIRLKTRGYYFFNPGYIMAYADSTIGNHEVNLFLNIKKTTPELARHPYTINRIMVFPNYTLLQPPPDTSKRATINVDGILVRDTLHKFRPDLFRRTITYRPGKLYSSIDQNTTLNRFINLGAFKFVKNRFEPLKDSGIYKLNAYYYLTPAKKRAIQAEIDAFSKDNRYLGSQVSVNWKHRNAFRGAEQLAIKAYGGAEISIDKTITNNNNYRLGGEASVTFPRFMTPFHIKDSNFYPPRTQMLIGYELFIRQSLYTKNAFRFQYEFSWKEAANKQHILAPIAITYLNATNVTDSFYAAARLNPSILVNVYSEAILGSFYSYTYNTLHPYAKNQWFFNGSIDLSGNLAGLFTGAKRFREKKVFNTPFAQYVKADVDLRYKRRLKSKLEWANRLQIGFGLPYSNSSLLPFSKQYIIGGANSLRGFSVRTVGPGSYLPTANDIKYFQSIGGDYKLLVNSELRVPVAGSLFAAIFLDIGNIWTKDTLLFGKAGQLKNSSWKELAVSSGIGLRYDASVILIRLDLGIPLRKPFLPDGQQWVLNKFAFGDKYWRRDNLIVNIAIGYPF